MSTNHLKDRNAVHRSEAGVVSIVVAMMLIVLIGLLVLAFGQVARREQREALDAQLSTQAFYAAESGINDAKAKIAEDLMSHTLASKNTCAPDSHYTADNKIATDGSVAYTCLLVNATPDTLTASIAAGKAAVIRAKAAAGNTIPNLVISWPKSSDGPTSDCPGTVTGTVFPTTTDWHCPYGVIRADIVSTSNLSRGGLMSGLMSGLLVPQSNTSGGNISLTPASRKALVGASCDSDRCSVTITLQGTENEYYLRLSSLYAGDIKNVEITTKNKTIQFEGSQVVIDATGKAQDVLRREVVTIPLTVTGQAPVAALQSGTSVCKRFNVANGLFDAESPAADDSDSGNPVCGY